ncbi:hypothetical protein [Paenibacillus rhizoplanae]|uniref:hypothetical protein n=1 Tax=Paenibacillus rhizoplanae TaxID=1917181 RepID=UPI00361E87B1
MKQKSEISGLISIAGGKKGLLVTASFFSVLSSFLQLAPFVAVYKIIEELLIHAGQPSEIDKDVLLFWGGVRICSDDSCIAHFLHQRDELPYCSL